MTEQDRTAKLLEQLRVRRSSIEISRETFLRAVQTSDDPDEIIAAAQGSLRAEGELRAIDVAARSLTELAESSASEHDRLRGRLRAAHELKPGAVRQQVAEYLALLLEARSHADAALAVRTTIDAWKGPRDYIEALTIATVAQLAVHTVTVAPGTAVPGLISRYRTLVTTLRDLGFSTAEVDEIETTLPRAANEAEGA